MGPVNQPEDAPGKPDVVSCPGTASGLHTRPRLIFAIPEDGGQQGLLGHALGEYLNHGSDADLAPLAMMYMECVARSDLDLGGAHASDRDAGPFTAVVVAHNGGVVSTRVIRFDLAAMQHRSPRLLINGKQAPEDDGPDPIDQRIATLAGVVRQAAMPDGSLNALWPDAMAHPRVSAIAERARRGKPIHLFEDETFPWLLELEDSAESDDEAPTPLSPGEVERYAPGLYAAALQGQDRSRADLLGALAGVVRKRLVQGHVTGSEWARTAGCGTNIEGRRSAVVIGCGMGFTPERSQRFLYFYVDSDE